MLHKVIVKPALIDGEVIYSYAIWDAKILTGGDLFYLIVDVSK